MTDTATLQVRLVEAETARHKIATGKGVQTITYRDGGSVTYSRATLSDLDSYIASLKSEIAGATADPASRRRPIFLGFG